MRTSLDIIAILWIVGLVLLLVLLAPVIGFMFRVGICALLIYMIYRVSMSIIGTVTSHFQKSDANGFDSDPRITYGAPTQHYDDSVDDQ